MKAARRRDAEDEVEPVRVLGRGLRAQRGVRLTLRGLRDATGKTQTDIAALTRIDQSDISRLERRSDFDECQVATLQRYIEALGGSLEIVATFGAKRITLAGVSDESAAQHGVPADEARRDMPSSKQRSNARALPTSSSGAGRPRR
jgi:transcriptional regulator with XRE-family HTH domain